MESLSSEDLVNLLSQFNISQEGISEFESKINDLLLLIFD